MAIKQTAQEPMSGQRFKAQATATIDNLRPAWGKTVGERMTSREVYHDEPDGLAKQPLPILPGQVFVKPDYQK